jgi:hypothetical protein
MRIFLPILSNPGLLNSMYALVPEYLYTREDKGMTSDMNGFYPVSGLFLLKVGLLSDVGEFF